MSSSILAGACALLLAAQRAHAEPVALPDTRVEHLTSTTNGVTYRLLVSVPPDFDARDVEYPLVLLLDADYSFPVAHSIATHLRERSDLPDLVLAAIAYDGPPAYKLNRTRDYTPTHAAEGGYGPDFQRVSGGGPAFLGFIERELLPWMRAHYRTGPQPVIVGHSYGGLFVLWAMLTRKDLFGAAIAVSPSLWYDDHMLARLEAGLSRDARQGNGTVYAAVGAREGNADRGMVRDLEKLGARLGKKRYPLLRTKVEVLDDETHNSVFPRALSSGLRFIWPRGTFTPSKAPGTRTPIGG
jgi:predicted alpha/beta superfamily hydrolase